MSKKTKNPSKIAVVASHKSHKIKLADFIHENTPQIVAEWQSFARTLNPPAATDKSPLALRDHIHEMLAFIVSDMKSPQTNLEQIEKSQGKKEKAPTPTAAETHAALRMAGGFNIDQMDSEYRALRASVIKLWSQANTQMNITDIPDMIRFNESIDQELAESVSHYTHKINYSKDLSMEILSHELRSPLNVISMSAQLMLNIGLPNEKNVLNDRQQMLTTQIFESATYINKIINDLIDVNRARFGAGLPAIRTTTDMAFISRQMVDEMQAAYPTRTIILEISGDLKGKWDKARIGQIFSNLIGNAVQYGFRDSPVDVAVKGTSEEVVLSVHNEGIPILPEKIATLFDSVTYIATKEGNRSGKFISLGLGLYIAKDIVVSHGGTIDVISSEENGTTFAARFPRLL
ncbi:MAG: sensor histidine kinase [Pseudomonadota bacterium]